MLLILLIPLLLGDDFELVSLVLLLAQFVLLDDLLLLHHLLLLLVLQDLELQQLFLLLPQLQLGGHFRGVVGRVVGHLIRRLEQLQVLVVVERRRQTVDFEPVGTNEILLVEHRVVRAHEFEISNLKMKSIIIIFFPFF